MISHLPNLLILEPVGFPAGALARLKASFQVRQGPVARDDLARAVADAEVLITRLAHRCDSELFDAAPKLRAIVSATTGLNHIDLNAARSRGIKVLSLKGETEFLATITATAELAWGLALALARFLPAAHAHAVSGGWDRDSFRGRELRGGVCGVVGFGRLGSMVAGYARSFGMQILAADPHVTPPHWVEKVPLEVLVREASLITLHVPSEAETRHLLGPREFAAMQDGCLVVNTSRGDIIDEAALAAAVESGRIGGAALDVLQEEYDLAAKPAGDRLRRLAATGYNLILTPHIGGACTSVMARAEQFMVDKLLKNWEGVLAETPGGSRSA